MGFAATNPEKKVFISWVKHTTRSESFARAMEAESYFFDQGASWSVLKYVPRTILTLSVLLGARPSVVYCMNPPYFVGLIAWCYTLIWKARFVLDSHTAAFDSPKWTWMQPLHAFLVRRSACSTVTNAELRRRVEDMGGKGVKLSDIPYEMPGGDYPLPEDKFTVCFSCTYASDEPILEVFEAARRLPEVFFYVTGNDKKAAESVHRAKPDNVTLTGYLSNEEYGGLIRNVSAMLVLTTRDFTMQRGGSEAISVGVPLITSDWPTLREIFHAGTVHVANTANGIHEGILKVQRDHGRLAEEMQQLREERAARFEEVRKELERLLWPASGDQDGEKPCKSAFSD